LRNINYEESKHVLGFKAANIREFESGIVVENKDMTVFTIHSKTNLKVLYKEKIAYRNIWITKNHLCIQDKTSNLHLYSFHLILNSNESLKVEKRLLLKEVNVRIFKYPYVLTKDGIWSLFDVRNGQDLFLLNRIQLEPNRFYNTLMNDNYLLFFDFLNIIVYHLVDLTKPPLILENNSKNLELYEHLLFSVGNNSIICYDLQNQKRTEIVLWKELLWIQFIHSFVILEHLMQMKTLYRWNEDYSQLKFVCELEHDFEFSLECNNPWILSWPDKFGNITIYSKNFREISSFQLLKKPISYCVDKKLPRIYYLENTYNLVMIDFTIDSSFSLL